MSTFLFKNSYNYCVYVVLKFHIVYFLAGFTKFTIFLKTSITKTAASPKTIPNPNFEKMFSGSK